MSPSTSGDAALSVPVNPHGGKPVSVPHPRPETDPGSDQAAWQAQDQLQWDRPASTLSLPILPRAPGSDTLDAPAAGEGPKAGAVTAQTTPVPSFENNVAPHQNDKRPTRPASATATATVAPKRPHGPSLLTQKLAAARGLPLISGQSFDASHPSPRLPHSQYDQSIGSHPKQDFGQATGPTSQLPKGVRETCYESDGDTLTPRASPRLIAMAPTAAVETISLPSRVASPFLSRTLDTAELEDVDSRFRGHRDFLSSSGRGTSLERTDKEKRLKELTSGSRTYSDTMPPPTLAATMTLDRDLYLPSAESDTKTTTGPQSPIRPRKPDHRVSLGPEKAWSIGSEDLNNGGDGQVEKSIAEVLAGVEPSARSRKASHSLRFFKEGLPEEHKKRRDRLSPTAVGASLDGHRGNVRGDDHAKSLQTSPCPIDEQPGGLIRTNTFPQTGLQGHGEPVQDYFRTHREQKGHVDPVPPLEEAEEEEEEEKQTQETVPAPTVTGNGEQQNVTGTAADNSDAVEDGDLSGEEKISSAVFLPHKGPKDAPEAPARPEADKAAPVVSCKPHPRKDDASSWLVKADEPEVDESECLEAPTEGNARDAALQRLESGHHTIGAEPSSFISQVTSTPAEHDFAPQVLSMPSQLLPPMNVDNAHDYHEGADEPLDAIELVPYSHQVGGHTTIWKFSKRAVCKQLNNRENEFYEDIERYHRDLLPFLPRYVKSCSDGALIQRDVN